MTSTTTKKKKMDANLDDVMERLAAAIELRGATFERLADAAQRRLEIVREQRRAFFVALWTGIQRLRSLSPQYNY
ncbi:hypothetical protein CPLU01_06075 [Colletotrichum plurivorum]|uniref:Uncharacterized protein n=1 Tax=Colletotrichum plurivorum TaxID=2175906 RepID=A0A8H6NH01_9PEZI|nr:hypothetical protein CPLU01_06075 [Colletotrichum plurivorum]